MLDGGKKNCLLRHFLLILAKKRSDDELSYAFTNALVLTDNDCVRPICLKLCTSGLAIASFIIQQLGNVCKSSDGTTLVLILTRNESLASPYYMVPLHVPCIDELHLRQLGDARIHYIIKLLLSLL